MYIRPTFLPEATLAPGICPAESSDTSRLCLAELYERTSIQAWRIATETRPIHNNNQTQRASVKG